MGQCCHACCRPLNPCSPVFLKTWIRKIKLPFAVIFALVPLYSGEGQSVPPLKLEQKIPLPGVTGRIDHFAADIVGKRLFVAALGNGSVEVLDAERGERLSEIKGLKEPQGVLYDAERNRLYVATGGEGKVRVYDGRSLNPESTLDFGDDADNLRVDPRSGDSNSSKRSAGKCGPRLLGGMKSAFTQTPAVSSSQTRTPFDRRGRRPGASGPDKGYRGR
jgi:hypothetical protein